MVLNALLNIKVSILSTALLVITIFAMTAALFDILPYMPKAYFDPETGACLYAVNAPRTKTEEKLTCKNLHTFDYEHHWVKNNEKANEESRKTNR